MGCQAPLQIMLWFQETRVCESGGTALWSGGSGAPKSGYSVLLLARLAQRRAQERVRRYQQTLATLQRRRKRR